MFSDEHQSKFRQMHQNMFIETLRLLVDAQYIDRAQLPWRLHCSPVCCCWFLAQTKPVSRMMSPVSQSGTKALRGSGWTWSLKNSFKFLNSAPSLQQGWTSVTAQSLEERDARPSQTLPLGGMMQTASKDAVKADFFYAFVQNYLDLQQKRHMKLLRCYRGALSPSSLILKMFDTRVLFV